ncbi:hypothetical protein IQ251_08495 [Saccharopolyspora sp. HNM0983]|uniref:DUF1542 domain-containing protein n=1 Tax=Saccharopolyspora montiporae TaxID=2781240 RepID=A0A929BBG7_9PSEU|nr:hypothetical protein [Saccharopolyspora sp. HNM0983]MBE9374487.1 hypothetical protein [Saccharopolyspora sp. HNM0983]
MTALIVIAIAAAVIVVAVWWSRRTEAAHRAKQLEDAKADARRWVERLGGQVLNLVGTNEAAKQALADAAERHTAAVSQLEQADTAEKAKLTTDSALEGLYYARAARLAMDMDPGPDLPDVNGRSRAGKVTEHREVEVEGERQVASPEPSEATPHYYPGGQVAGRPVPEGWYSQPWWKPALVAGAWGVGTFMLTSALLGGMTGVPAAAAGGDPAGGDAGGGDPGGDGGDPGDGGDAGDGGDFDFDFDLGF